MTTSNPAIQITPDDLLRLEGGDSLYELVDGVLVKKHMGSLSGETTSIINMRLLQFILDRKLGKLYSELTFRCFPHKPNQVRRPDIAFIFTARLPQVPKEGHVQIVPDLAVEIVSPSDGFYDVDEKLADYKAAAIPLTWIFNPERRLVRVYELGRLKAELEEDEELRGESVLPGFAAPVREFFPQI